MNPKRIIALVLITISIVVSPVFYNKAFAEKNHELINLSGSIYYNNTIEKFENNILHIEVDKDATIKASIDIKLLDKAKDKQTIDNVFLIAQITKKGEDIKREYIDIKSDDLIKIIYKNKTIKACIGGDGFSAWQDKISKNLDISFFKAGEYTIDFYVCKKGEKGKGNVSSSRSSSRRKKRSKKEEIQILEYDHWAHDCIIALLNHGIIKGYPDNTIRPENYITRAEMSVILSNALSLEPEDSKLLFKDEIPKWAENQIAELAKRHIFKGYPDGKFRPKKHITRQEAIAALVRAFCKETIKTEISFKDTHAISPWARGYVSTGVNKEILTGYPDNTFKPRASITRAEVFTIMCKLLGYHEEHNLSR